MIARLRIKFSVIILLIVTFIMFLAFYSNYAIIKEAFYAQSMNLLNHAVETGHCDKNKTFLLIVDSTGIEQQIGNERNDAKELVAIAKRSKENVGEIKDKELRFLKKDLKNGTLIAFTSTAAESTALGNMTKYATKIITAVVIIFFGLALFLAYYTTKPVSESIQKQKQLFADASHELKTPITAILASSDILLSGDISDDDRNWLNGIKTSAEDMSYLINDMLSIAHSDSEKQKLQMECVDLSDLVTSACLNFEAVFFEAGKKFDYDTESDIFIEGNANSLKQLIKIFLDNAGKYSNQGGIIFLSLKRRQDKALLAVYNSGDPIPNDELHKIFERFYRVDKARTVKNGSGLGLSIAKRIAEDHGTKIGVSSNDSGTCFFIEFKTVKPKNM